MRQPYNKSLYWLHSSLLHRIIRGFHSSTAAWLSIRKCRMDGSEADGLQRAEWWRIRSPAISATAATTELGVPDVSRGRTLASTTRRPLTPCTLSFQIIFISIHSHAFILKDSQGFPRIPEDSRKFHGNSWVILDGQEFKNLIRWIN